MRRVLVFAVLLVLAPGGARATDYEDAQSALGIMAAVRVCGTTVPDTAKRSLYGDILKSLRTPSVVEYALDQEVEALNKLSPSDRTAMCEAIGDRLPH
jgi:hypothetical protein